MGRKNRIKNEKKLNPDNNIKKVDCISNINKPSQDDLFDNPMVRAAMAAMSDEDKEKYRILGEHMYKDVDFEKNTVNTIPEPMAEAVAYVEMQLKSGIHPSFLEDNEKYLLEDVYGKEWYTKWGYIEADLLEIVTVVH